MHKQRGFTLIEIAIVLVIIGLLLGGVLKGQELITAARVRNLISQQDGVKAAYFGFLDRFRALPGDYSQATTNIAGVAAGANGNNNGRIETKAVGGGIDEHIAAWDHLSHAGFINGSYTWTDGAESNASVPTNPYARYLRLIYDANYATNAGALRHNLKTGNQIPSDLLSEIDRKIDDGNPVGGTFQFTTYDGGGAGGVAPVGGAVNQCYLGTSWSSTTVDTNCGGTSLF
jgi:prepilin-type N-terminal cleavage/methylation domain-containing protein